MPRWGGILRRSPQYRWVILAMAFLSVFGAIGFGRFGYSAVLPAMQGALGLTSAAAGSLASWTLIGYTITAAVGGVLASRLGPRFVLTIGLAVTTLGMLVTGFSDGLAGASIGRLVTGMGNGMILVPAIGLMAAWFDVRRVGLASSIVPTGSSLAMVLAGPLVPRLIAGGGEEGWRLAWYFFAGVTLLLTVVNLLVMRDRPSLPTEGRALLFGRRTGAAHSSRETTGSDVLGILRSGYAWHLGMIYFLYGIGFLTYFTFFQKRLTADLGYSAETAGNLFLVRRGSGPGGRVLLGHHLRSHRPPPDHRHHLGARGRGRTALRLGTEPRGAGRLGGPLGVDRRGHPRPGGSGLWRQVRGRPRLRLARFRHHPRGSRPEPGAIPGRPAWATPSAPSAPAYLLSAGVYALGSLAALVLPETRTGRAAVSAARPDTSEVLAD